MTPEVLTLSETPWLYTGVMLVKIIVAFVATLLIVAYATYAERKIIGRMQTRMGPNMTGPKGLLQPIADGLKLFFKEDIIPSQAHWFAFILAPMMILAPAFISISVIPFGGDLQFSYDGILYAVPMQITDLNIGVLFIVAMAGLGVYGIVLAGLASNSKYALLGGIRSTAQMVSYELAVGLSIVAIFMLSETLSLRGIVAAQQLPLWGLESVSFIPNWYIFCQPLAFGLFVIGSMAEINRTPFDLPEAETELVSGFCTEYSTLFLGGWGGPFYGWINFLIKVFAFMFFFIWIRATFPRLRYDQLMFLGWKIMLPLALVNIVITGIAILLW